jgi:hypothetical protein
LMVWLVARGSLAAGRAADCFIVFVLLLGEDDSVRQAEIVRVEYVNTAQVRLVFIDTMTLIADISLASPPHSIREIASVNDRAERQQMLEYCLMSEQIVHRYAPFGRSIHPLSM